MTVLYYVALPLRFTLGVGGQSSLHMLRPTPERAGTPRKPAGRASERLRPARAARCHRKRGEPVPTAPPMPSPPAMRDFCSPRQAGDADMHAQYSPRDVATAVAANTGPRVCARSLAAPLVCPSNLLARCGSRARIAQLAAAVILEEHNLERGPVTGDADREGPAHGLAKGSWHQEVGCAIR